MSIDPGAIVFRVASDHATVRLEVGTVISVTHALGMSQFGGVIDTTYVVRRAAVKPNVVCEGRDLILDEESAIEKVKAELEKLVSKTDRTADV